MLWRKKLCMSKQDAMLTPRHQIYVWTISSNVHTYRMKLYLGSSPMRPTHTTNTPSPAHALPLPPCQQVDIWRYYEGHKQMVDTGWKKNEMTPQQVNTTGAKTHLISQSRQKGGIGVLNLCTHTSPNLPHHTSKTQEEFDQQTGPWPIFCRFCRHGQRS